MTLERMFMFLILSLATWRLSSLFAREKGPFDVFTWIRKKIYTRTVYNLMRALFITLNDGLSCMWCNSVWFGLLLAPIISTNPLEWIIMGLALSTVAIIVEEKLNGNRIN